MIGKQWNAKRIGMGAVWALIVIGLSAIQAEAQHKGSHAMPGKEFHAFKDDLLQAIETNDTTFIFSRIDTDIFNGFGFDTGKEAFISIWKEPNGSMGRELEKAIRLGGYYDKESDRVFMPYLWMTFPDSLDAFDTMWVLACDRPEPGQSECRWPAYAEPDTTSAILARLPERWVDIVSWDVSDETNADGNPKWMSIQAEAGGDTLMVQTRHLRSPIDYRFWFEQKQDRWFLMGWAAGD